jgi:positive phototaxis protein PixI
VVSDLLSPTDLASPQEEEEFLRFSLDAYFNNLLPVSQLAEVLTIPIGRILPISHINAWVMGVYNWRGEIIWMVDLGQLVGLRPLHEQNTFPSSYQAIVLRVPLGLGDGRDENQTIGVVVSQIGNIERYNPNSIEPPSRSTPSELTSFLRGYFLNTNCETLAVFDSKLILAAMPDS